MENEGMERLEKMDVVIRPGDDEVLLLGEAIVQARLRAGDSKAQVLMDVLTVAAIIVKDLGVKNEDAHKAFAECLKMGADFVDWVDEKIREQKAEAEEAAGAGEATADGS